MAITSIPANDRVERYTASAAQTAFPFDFPTFAATDLDVRRVRAGVETLLTLNVDYTVTGAGDQAGGTVTLTTGATASDLIVINSAQPAARTTQFFTGGDLTAAALNAELNRIAIDAQQVQAALSRTFRMSHTDPVHYPLPPASERAGGILGFDSNGAPIVATLAPPDALVTSTFGRALVLDNDAAAARDRLRLTDRSATVDLARITAAPGNLAAPGVTFAGIGGLYNYTAAVDPVYGGTKSMALELNGVPRFVFFESQFSMFVPPGVNLSTTDGTRTFHIGNDLVSSYVGTATDHPLRLTSNSGSGPGITLDTIGDVIRTTVGHPVCIGTTDATGNASGFVFDDVGGANAVLRSTSGSGSRTHLAFYKTGGPATLVGEIVTSDTATSYLTTSDEDLKLIDGPIIDSGDIIDALEPILYRWKVAPEGAQVPGFGARATHPIVPSAVIPGDEARPWMMELAKLMPYAIAELKALRQRVAVLEAAAGP